MLQCVVFLLCHITIHLHWLDMAFDTTLYLARFSKVLIIDKVRLGGSEKTLESSCPGLWSRSRKDFNSEESESQNILTTPTPG